MRTTTTTSLLAGAVILACSHWTVASLSSEIDFQSPASPFEQFLSARSGEAVACPRTSKVCRKRGGYCVEADTCDTVDINVFCSKDKSCTCCAKDMSSICKPKKRCTEMGGFCIVNAKACKGGGKLLKKQCKCKSYNGRGHCCAPPVPHWSYSGEHGPDGWGDLYATCAGTAQSPIETTTADLEDGTTKDYNADKWVWTNYNVPPNNITIKNNGHSASITWNGVSTASINGGYLGADYTLAGFHFHWGADSTKGSEHIIDSQSPIELHLVHYKTEYGDIGTAIQNAEGLAVLGILYEIDSTLNPQLTPIIDALPSIIEPDAETTVSFGQNLDTLLPSDTTAFMRYSGSLTTPTCNEVVTWTVFTGKSTISEDQIAEFRKLKFDDGTLMVDNFRPPQDLNGRTVTYVKV